MKMQYYRPNTVEEAIALKSTYPNSNYVGGGFSFKNQKVDCVLIDLQSIPKYIKKENDYLDISSTKTLEDILTEWKDFRDIATALRNETSKNLRNQITIGGLIKKADGRSPFLCCLTALESWLILEPGNKKVKLTDFVKTRENNNDLIVKINIQIPEIFHFESVGRSPMDKPIVCCAYAKNHDTQLISIGGFGEIPFNIDPDLLNRKMELNKYLEKYIKDDQWATSTYRISVIMTLINRLLAGR